MPWKPASVGKQRTQYDERWKRIRSQTLQSEPLCRLCLAGGKTVPATVVDHIVPLAEGGTHESGNLQPLCKRCHDAIKTPADVAARKRAEAVGLKLLVLDFRAQFAGAGVIDQRAIRRVFAAGCNWSTAHALSLAAMDGIVAAAQRGDLPRLTGIITTDDARWARGAGALMNLPIAVQPLTEWSTSAAAGTEEAWLRERWGTERDARQQDGQGPQPASTLQA